MAKGRKLARAFQIIVFPVGLIMLLARRRARRPGVPPHRGGPDTGVREPRRRGPLTGAGAAAAPIPKN
ncbi:MAG: hypothetical protein WDA27_03125 [Actinomycetota bacterium]